MTKKLLISVLGLAIMGSAMAQHDDMSMSDKHKMWDEHEMMSWGKTMHTWKKGMWIVWPKDWADFGQMKYNKNWMMMDDMHMGWDKGHDMDNDGMKKGW